MLRLGVPGKGFNICFDTGGWVAVWPGGRLVPGGCLDVTKRVGSSHLMISC